MTSKDCICCEACDYLEKETYPNDHEKWDYTICRNFKNKANFIELPCQVGHKVFWVTTTCNDDGEEFTDIYEGEIVSFSIQKEGLWAYCRYDNGLTYWHVVSDYFGRTLFFTKEVSEEALAKLSEVEE